MSTTTGPDGTEETPAAKKEPVRQVQVTETGHEPNDETIETDVAVKEDSPVDDEAPAVEKGSPVEKETPGVEESSLVGEAAPAVVDASLVEEKASGVEDGSLVEDETPGVETGSLAGEKAPGVVDGLPVGEEASGAEDGPLVEDETPGVVDGSLVGEKAPAAGDGGPGGTSVALEATPSRFVDVLTVAVVVLALLASFGLYKWQAVSGEEGEREALIKRVTEYGNSVADFDYRDLQKSVDRSLSFLTGDALARQQRDLEVGKLEKDWTEKQLTLSSKTQNVYITELNGNLAGAVLVFDINAESPLFGATKTGPQPVLVKSHLTLGMVKIKGVWMVSSLTPAGTESDGSAVPGLGTGTGSTTSTAAPTVTPTTTK